MTSVFRTFIDGMPDDDGRDIDDGIVETQPAAPLVKPPEPIRPVEYLLLNNYGLKQQIQHLVDGRAREAEAEDSIWGTAEWNAAERLCGSVTDIFGVLGDISWSEMKTPSMYSGEKHKIRVEVDPYIVLVIATKGLPFLTPYEMEEYVRNILISDPRDGGGYWGVRRIVRERAIAIDDEELSSEMDKRPPIVTCDQVRELVLNDFVSDDEHEWPPADVTASQRGAFEEWALSRQPPDLAERVQRWLGAGRNIEIYNRLGRRRDRAAGAEKVEMLVDDLVPARMVTLLVGERESGKSTLATELAVAVATGRDEWLGRKINQDRVEGFAVLLTGEDTDAVINGRLVHLDPDDDALRLVVYALDGRPLAHILAEIAAMPAVSLIVVDPARRYLQGDEDASSNVDEFFAALDEMARRTGAAVLVLHHLRKDANPTSLAQVREAVRGSSVFLDRPRVALGCFRLRRDDVTIIGGIKSNLPPDYPIVTAIKLRRDAVTLRHIPVENEAVIEADEVGERDDLERKVLGAIVRLAANSQRITRTGGRELWSLHPSELEGIGRNRIREAVDQLISDGLLAAGARGIEVVA